jgi:hypothetical protein
MAGRSAGRRCHPSARGATRLGHPVASSIHRGVTLRRGADAGQQTSQPLQDGTHCLAVAVTFPWECKPDSSAFLSNARARQSRPRATGRLGPAPSGRSARPCLHRRIICRSVMPNTVLSGAAPHSGCTGKVCAGPNRSLPARETSDERLTLIYRQLWLSVPVD